ncbi:MAG TPA: GNAT family N-acetyltransferase [Stackebrandtia sp.]|uniref:GNAT family N-acetyltransferase n=1 Tax=Stackebrandtia sp. TaxID=2023065 RepID=UPI002D3E47D3|nr:GNAT family N-acetyltransferase [Stackebrandtia sp.]HZE41670.1 GNAT family N-acetyltransferase [Stackebrandtia sp.]
MTDATIRSATVDDEAAWVACAAGLFAEDGGTRDAALNVNWPHEHGAQSFHTGLSSPDRLLLVAEDGGEVAGTLSGQLRSPSAMRPVSVAELVSLFVVPRMRGGGVGARLVEGFLAWARSCEAELVQVSAYAANAGAVRFYERMGFSPHQVQLERRL